MRDSSAATLLKGPLGPSRIYLVKAKTQAALRPPAVSPWVPLRSHCTQRCQGPAWGPGHPGLPSLAPPPDCVSGRASLCHSYQVVHCLPPRWVGPDPRVERARLGRRDQCLCVDTELLWQERKPGAAELTERSLPPK